MSTFRGNNELALHVADPASAVAFYTNVLGCTEISRSPTAAHSPDGVYVRDPHGVLFDVIERRLDG